MNRPKKKKALSLDSRRARIVLESVLEADFLCVGITVLLKGPASRQIVLYCATSDPKEHAHVKKR